MTSNELARKLVVRSSCAGTLAMGVRGELAIHFNDRHVVKPVSASAFALRPVTTPHSEDMPKSELILNGQPTGKIIDGAFLEAAIRWHEFLLVFVTDGITHEEMLRIYLFDSSLNLVDYAQLGWMYVTGVFSLLELRPPNTVRFLFFGDTDWTVELFDDKVFAIPFFTDPRGVSRPLRFNRRFQISGNPKPEPQQHEQINLD